MHPMTLDDVLAGLASIGVMIDVEKIKHYNYSDNQLVEVEKNLWQLYHECLVQRHIMNAP